MNDMPPTTPKAPDDAELGELVRGLAEEWTMPPQRLDERTWRDRVGPGRQRTARAPIRWAGRATRATGAAVAATVVLALAAVWLTLPRTSPAGPRPTGSEGASPPFASSPAQSPLAEQSPLPVIARFGALPTPSRIVVGTGSGYALLDLATGRLGPAFGTWGSAYSPLLALPEGGYISLSTTTLTTATTDGLTVTIRIFDAQGALRSAFPPGSAGGSSPGASPGTRGVYVGQTDPAVSGPGSDQGPSAAIEGSLSQDGRYLYLGWTERRPPLWHTGIDVVDLSGGSIVQTVRLPDVPSSQFSGGIYAWAPHVVVARDARHAVVRATTVEKGQGTDGWWSASLDGPRLGALTPFATGSGSLDACMERFILEGFASNASYFAICGSTGQPAVLRRVHLDGRPIGDTTLPGLNAGQLPGEVAVAVVRPAGVLYAWGPFTGSLVRVDLGSGRVTGTGAILRPSAATEGPLDVLGPLAAGLGHWLAPQAAAKMYLQPAMVLSPDGARIYALGVNGTSPLDAGAGSSGVWVFDASTLAVVGHWAPTADFISIAVSQDGRFVYAAGMSGVDASGNQGPFEASVTAFDAASGSVWVIAGRLGDAFIDLAPGGSLSYP